MTLAAQLNLRARSAWFILPAGFWAYTLALAVLAITFACSPNFRPVSSVEASPFAGDFLQEWIAGRMLREGDRTRFYDPQYAKDWEHRLDVVGLEWKPNDYFPMVYPPFYYALVSPLSWLPFQVAALIWAAFMVLAYLAAWRIFVSLHGSLTSSSIAWLLPLSLLFVPLIESLTSCQKGSVLLLILTATFALLQRGQSFWAGVVFGLIAFKPQYALPIAIAMLCKQQWRFVLGGLTTGLLLGGCCLSMGFDMCAQYVEFSRHAADYIHNGGYDLTKSHAWYGFFSLLLGHDSTLVKSLTLVAMLITIGITAYSLRGPLMPRQSRFAQQFSVLILCSILISPHVYTYDLTMLLLPLGFIVREMNVACVQEQKITLTSHSSQSIHIMGLLLFCLAGVAPKFAGFTGFQLTVPLMFLLLLAMRGSTPTSIISRWFTTGLSHM